MATVLPLKMIYYSQKICFWEEGDKSKCNVSLMTHHLMADYLTDNCTPHWSFHDYRLSFVLFSLLFLLNFIECSALVFPHLLAFLLCLFDLDFLEPVVSSLQVFSARESPRSHYL